jgi:hypothetical protein
MTNKLGSTRLLLIFSLLGALLLGACQGQIVIDIPNGGESDSSGAAASQTIFILLIVLLVAMVAMVFVAMSSR